MNQPPVVPAALTLEAVELPEIERDSDLAATIADATTLRDGDVVVVTSKIVSKAEGRDERGDRLAAVAAESVRVLARRGDSVIAETRHGMVMAAAGVDASNVEPGTVLLLPADPDASARALRSRLRGLTGRNVAVVISDTAGRAWRNGQTDMAIGCAGLVPLVALHGTTDTHGNVLNVTAPALADEIAAAGDLVKGKATRRPVAVIRGYSAAVLPVHEHGPGAVDLIRDTSLDLFALGAREAALAAATRTDPVALAHFPPRTPPDTTPFAALSSDHPGVQVRVAGVDEDGAVGWQVDIDVPAPTTDALITAGRLVERTHAIAAAYRLVEQTTVPREVTGYGYRSVWVDRP